MRQIAITPGAKAKGIIEVIGGLTKMVSDKYIDNNGNGLTHSTRSVIFLRSAPLSACITFDYSYSQILQPIYK